MKILEACYICANRNKFKICEKQKFCSNFIYNSKVFQPKPPTLKDKILKVLKI